MTRNNNPWASALIWILFIYLTIPLARPVSDFCKKYFPFSNLIAVLAVFFLIFILWVILTRVSVKNSAGFFSLGIFVTSYAAMLVLIPIPEEKVHFMEYGVLAFLMFRALEKSYSAPTCYFLALILTSLVGWTDEGIQFLTPGRYYDNRDVVFNAIGGLLGLIFVFILRAGGRKDLKIL